MKEKFLQLFELLAERRQIVYSFISSGLTQFKNNIMNILINYYIKNNLNEVSVIFY